MSLEANQFARTLARGTDAVAAAAAVLEFKIFSDGAGDNTKNIIAVF